MTQVGNQQIAEVSIFIRVGVAESIDSHWSLILALLLTSNLGIGSYLMQYIKERNMLKKLVVVLAAAMMMAVPTLGLAALAESNTVNSAAIIDGQVKTADIANGAVTAAKLGILCSTGQTLQFTSTGWVCSAGTPGPQGPQGIQGSAGPQGIQGIQGAIGPIGLTGATGPQGIKGDKGDTGTAGPAAHYANVIIVAKSGGDFADIQSAINSAEPTAENPFLIKIMPGVYDVGTGTITVKPNVYLEGAGADATIITGNPAGEVLVQVSGNSEIRSLSVVNTGGANLWHAIGMSLLSGNIVLNDVTVKTTNAFYDNLGIIINGDAAATITNSRIYATAVAGQRSFALSAYSTQKAIYDNLYVEATAPGVSNAMAIRNDGSGKLSMNNVKSVSTYSAFSNTGTAEVKNSVLNGMVAAALYKDGGTTIISNTKITGDFHAWRVNQEPVTGTVNLSFTEIDGVFADYGTNAAPMKCFNVHDSNYAAKTCPQ